MHTHYDSAMDSAVVAERTGARMVGGTSAVQVDRGARSAVRTDWVVRPRPANRCSRSSCSPDTRLVESRTLSARPLPGRDHRTGRPTAEGIGLQVRRGLVDASYTTGPPTVGC